MSPLDAVTFGAKGYTLTRDEPGQRVWTLPSGDGLGLFHFNKRPDIEGSIASTPALRTYYRGVAEDCGHGIVEIERRTIDRCAAIRTLLKVAQSPSGMTYLGSLTLPFRDFSYVLKVQCEEHGITGVRDTAILMKLMGSGDVSIDEPTGDILGWANDPYDSTYSGPMVRNRSEQPEYDALFPEHPLTRARTILAHLEQTARVSPQVRAAAPFS